MWAAGGRREFRLPQPKATLGAERPAMEGADYTRRRGQCKCSRSAAARALNRGSESPAAGAPAPPSGCLPNAPGRRRTDCPQRSSAIKMGRTIAAGLTAPARLAAPVAAPIGSMESVMSPPRHLFGHQALTSAQALGVS